MINLKNIEQQGTMKQALKDKITGVNLVLFTEKPDCREEYSQNSGGCEKLREGGRLADYVSCTENTFQCETLQVIITKASTPPNTYSVV